jgi:hypothetical protein
MDVEWGVADLSPGNAADHTDSGQPGALTVAGAATTSAGKMATTSGVASAPRATTDEPDAPLGEMTGGLAARNEAAEGVAGEPRTGGGTGTPQRTGRGPEVAARVTAETIQVAGIPETDEGVDAMPQNADGIANDMASTRASPARSSTLTGGKGPAVTVDETPDGVASVGSGRRDKTPSAAEIPQVGGERTANGLVPRANPQLPSSTIEPVTVEGLPGLGEALAAASDPDGEQVLDAGDAEVGPVSRLAGPVLAVEVQAPSEDGGIGILLARDVGLKARQAIETSTDIQLESNRFSRNLRGGKLESTTTAAVPTDSFRGRMQRGQGNDAPADGTGPQTEEAVELGLVFLHQLQLPDGRWTLDRNADSDGMPQMASDTAATGLALLAFQGAGYHHLDHRYAQVVRNGIEFLVRNQQPDGSLYVPMDAESNRVVVFYSHSIAALALCEAYGMTQDAALREPAQRALNYIVTTQNLQRGGWRYSPAVSTDTSVTGWMMMALKSGELANLKVPSKTYVGISRWLDSAQASKSQPHLYCYNPYATDAAEQRGGRQPTRTMTSVGLLMRLYLGWRRDNPNLMRGAKYLALSPPAIGTTSNPQRDTYYWYYATQVMFHMGGQYWRDWNRHLHPVLVKGQIRNGPLAGSWDPARPVADRWGPHAGRLYVTTMNLLSLEVAYRHLPLYEDTAK